MHKNKDIRCFTELEKYLLNGYFSDRIVNSSTIRTQSKAYGEDFFQ